MEIAEIKDLLNKMNAFAEDGDSLDSTALMQDPIVLNRLAVELLQQIDGDAKQMRLCLLLWQRAQRLLLCFH